MRARIFLCLKLLGLVLIVPQIRITATALQRYSPSVSSVHTGQLISICSASVRCSDHKDDLFFLVDLIEETPATDSIPPRFGVKILQFPNIGPKMRMVTELGIDKLAKLPRDFAVPRPCDPAQVFLKLLGFKDAVFIGQSVLSEPDPPATPS